MPVGTVLFLAFLFRPLCMVQGELDWRLLMLLVGIPFGIRKMFLWVVPSGMGIGGTVGVAAFDLMAGGVIGSVIMVWRLLVAVLGRGRREPHVRPSTGSLYSMSLTDFSPRMTAAASMTASTSGL